MSAAAVFDQQIAERQAELQQLEELRRQVAAAQSRPAELRTEIEQLQREREEVVAQARCDYSNAFQPYVEARDAAIARVSELADAIEKALEKRSDLEAAYRALVNLGVEPDVPKPDRVEILQYRDRALQNEFVRLQSALAVRF